MVFIMFIYENIYNIILNLPEVPPEYGGIIGGQNDIIKNFVFDSGLATHNYDSYIPNVSKLNDILNEWHLKNIKFFGLLHTHRNSAETLSCADISYIKKFFQNNMFEQALYFPIVIPNEKIICYKAYCSSGDITIQKEHLSIIKRR